MHKWVKRSLLIGAILVIGFGILVVGVAVSSLRWYRRALADPAKPLAVHESPNGNKTTVFLDWTLLEVTTDMGDKSIALQAEAEQTQYGPRPVLSIGCEPGSSDGIKVTLISRVPNVWSSTSKTTVRVRVDDQPAQLLHWGTIRGTDAIVTLTGAITLLEQLTTAERLRVQFDTPASPESITAEFDVSRFRLHAGKLSEPCGWPRK